MRIASLGFLLVAALPTLGIVVQVNEMERQEAVYVSTATLPPTPLLSPLSTATVLFGGDAFFDRLVRLRIERNGGHFVFSCLADTLHTPDMTVVNLEGPITTFSSVSVRSTIGSPENYVFTFPTTTAALLRDEGIDVVSLANNHTFNFGVEGLRQTRLFLQEAGVNHFGASSFENTYYTTVRGVPLAFVAFNEFGAKDFASTTLHDIRTARNAGFLPVVFAHWGDEYVPPPSRVKKLAYQFVDAGAELVVGAHPHVVQESELYNDKYIYYSLGNFIFDQYFMDEVQKGLLLSVVFTPAGLSSVEEIPTTLERDGRTCITTP